MRILLAATVSALVLGAGSASAAPATFCVYKDVTDCPAGSDTSDHGNLNSALAHADSTPDADTVYIAPGTYDSAADHNNPNFTAILTNPVTITGAGSDRTTLTTTYPTATSVLRLTGPPGSVELSGVTVDAQGQVNVGLDATRVNAHDIAATGTTKDDFGTGVLLSSSSLRHSRLSTDGLSTVASVAGTGNVIADVEVSGANEGISVSAPAADTQIHRATIRNSHPLNSRGATVTIDDSLLISHLEFGNAGGIYAADTGTSNADVTADNVTVVFAGPPSAITTGVAVFSGDGDSQVTLHNSIVRGFEDSAVVTSAPGKPGDATLVLDYVASEHDPTGSGPHSFFPVAPPDVTIHADPQFVDPANGDYRLTAGSPLLDLSNLTPTGDISTTDLDGNPRVVGPLVDLGAYEYQRRAPSASASASPGSVLTGENVTFNGSASDPDHGDTFTYAWSFDDGGSATGASATHAFAVAGHHVGTLTVTDPTGQTATASAAVDVAALDGRPPLPVACEAVQTGNRRANVLTGTALGDLLRGLAGRDRLSGLAGDDCLEGGSGNDRLRGGQGRDKLTGGPGNDNLDGAGGADSYSGGPGRDRIAARDAVAETVDCGSGHDRARADRSDSVRHCEKVKRS